MTTRRMSRQKLVDDSFPHAKPRHSTIAKSVKDTFKDLAHRGKRERRSCPDSPRGELPAEKRSRKAFVDLTNSTVNVTIGGKKDEKSTKRQSSKHGKAQVNTAHHQDSIENVAPCEQFVDLANARQGGGVDCVLETFDEVGEDGPQDRRLSASTQLVAGLEPLQISGSMEDSMGVIPETYSSEPSSMPSPCGGNIKPPESMALCDGPLAGAQITPPATVESIGEVSSAASTVCSAGMLTSESGSRDIDEPDLLNPFASAVYVAEIYRNMHEKEEVSRIKPYLTRQTGITEHMRAILVDWLVEIQENFELVHETLYLTVAYVDRFLAGTLSVRREELQLVGATAMFVASKFEEYNPPPLDDFIFICDDAYTREELIQMEIQLLGILDYKLDIPIAYRFLRRYAKAAGLTMETHTLARYLCELSLQEYSFVSRKPSQLAAAALYMTLRMAAIGDWSSHLEYHTGYRFCEIVECVRALNELLGKPQTDLSSVRCKYSHEVFFRVAAIPPLSDAELSV